MEQLRPIAREVSVRFGLVPERLQVINHGFNTTFAVLSGGRKFALRINVNSERKPEELFAEVAWTAQLSKLDGLWVPEPQAATNGSRVCRIEWQAHGREYFAVLYSWLPGTLAYDHPTPEVARKLAEATLVLHNHGRGWAPPSDATLYRLETILFGKELRFAKEDLGVDIGVFQEVEARANAAIEYLAKSPPFPIHSDLHFGNVKRHRKRISIFDFDDCILGWPLLDIANTLYYMRRFEGAAELEKAYWEGLSTYTDEACDREAREALVAGRALMLCNEILAMSTADIRALAPGFIKKVEPQLRNYLHTGRFDAANLFDMGKRAAEPAV